MIEADNNDYDLATVQVFTSDQFAIGDTLPGRANGRDWIVHWRDATTLLIAPAHDPKALRSAHIYGRGGIIGQ